MLENKRVLKAEIVSKEKNIKLFNNTIVLFIAISILFISTFTLVGCSTSAKKPDNQGKLYLDIFSDKNALFNKYAISISLDGTEIGSVKNGEEFTYLADVVYGEHTIEFCKEGKNKPKATKTFSIAEDTAYSCKLKHDGLSIKVNNEKIDSYVCETDNTTVTSESSSESITESTEETNAVTEPTNTTANTETEAIIPVSSETTSIAETKPTTVSENITSLSFTSNEDIEIWDNSNTYTGSIIVNVIDEKSFSPSNIIFVSENPDVATIHFSGTISPTKLSYSVKPISVGETYIYAESSDGKLSSDRIKVIVNEPIEVDSIWIEESCTIDKGELVAIAHEIYPEDATDTNISWTSSDESVVTVSSAGYIKGVGYGEAEVTATTSNGCSATCQVTVALTQREMTYKYTLSRNMGDNIGKEWKHVAYVEEEVVKLKETYPITINADETLVFYCKSTEDDNSPDVGETTDYYTVTEEDLINGFTVEVEVYVTEDRGRNAGKTAYFVYTFTFTPA